MKVKIRIKLFAFMMIVIVPLIAFLLLNTINLNSIPLFFVALLFSFIIAWVLGDYFIINDYIRLKQFDALKSKYIYTSSHDLRTPMTAIKGLISMINDGDYGPVNKDIALPLSDVKTSIERLIQLINDLLILSRVQDGRLVFDMKDVDVKEMIDEVTVAMLPIAKQKGIALDILKGEPICIRVDPEKFKQVLFTLIQYSITFTQEKQITISFHRVGNYVYIEITNKEKNGAEILKEKQDPLPGGVGLDYYVAQEFTRKMGREVIFQTSEDNKKFAFIFALPVV